MTAAAVAGANAASPAVRRPSDAGLAPSTSLAGSIAAASSASRAPGGNGVCRMTPCTAGSADWPASTSSISPGDAAGPRSSTSHAIPARPAADAIERTYQALDSSSVALTTASRGGVPAAVSAAARSAVPERMLAASSLPGSQLTRSARARP
jgi:hypothetical protein